jgi:hypothetical protein
VETRLETVDGLLVLVRNDEGGARLVFGSRQDHVRLGKLAPIEISARNWGCGGVYVENFQIFFHIFIHYDEKTN